MLLVSVEKNHFKREFAVLNQPPSHAGQHLSRKERRLAKKQAKKGQHHFSNDYALMAQLKKAEQADASGQLELAANLYAELIDGRKDAAIAQFNAANFFQRNQRADIAYLGFKNAVTLEPANAEYWERFGRHLIVAGQNGAAVIACERVCALTPSDPESFLALANAHTVNGEPQKALAAADTAVKLRPHDATGHFRRGVYLGGLGEFEESHKALYRALELNPDLHDIYYRLARTGAKFEDTEGVVEKLKKTLADGKVSEEEKTNLLFAIARLQEQLNRHEDAFDYYLRANKTVFEQNMFDMNAVSRSFQLCADGYNREIFERFSAIGHSTDVPVFIIGMPRSGTTLVEQIIASHSQAMGAGELNKMFLLSKKLMADGEKGLVFADNLTELTSGDLHKMAEEYLSILTRQVSDNPTRITDKMPTNFAYLGLIKILFPNAAIIHCRRNPLDTCISCFTTHFGNLEMMGFSYDLEVLGRYYQEYEQIMAHWQSVLPGQILTVDYENLIANPQAICRNIIKHIGLDWEQQCLEFHNNRRHVQTASAWQVRQPLYNSSVGRWRNYEKYLHPLQQALFSD